MAGLLMCVYHTSYTGWYADTAAHIETSVSDYGHARLFGYLKTDAAGGFEFETIRPEGYPNSDLPAHIHVHFWSAGAEAVGGLPAELLFEEDERLPPDRKCQALRAGYLVAKNTGTKTQVNSRRTVFIT
jgi:protocatechuate 3,4-dioxygenase beta subunit